MTNLVLNKHFLLAGPGIRTQPFLSLLINSERKHNKFKHIHIAKEGTSRENLQS